MEASLDTNVIIHLYNANYQSVLFHRFEKIKVYEFIRSQELHRHAEAIILDKFDSYVKSGKIELITDEYLNEIGMFNVFQYHVKDIGILFEGSDLGEVYAIALAKTLGCICLVTDDIKERGPHYTLMRIPDSEVIPFSFWELLLMEYLEERISEQELLDMYNQICSISSLRRNFTKDLKTFIRRFWRDPYSDSEKKWMKDFCEKMEINAKGRLYKLSSFLGRM